MDEPETQCLSPRKTTSPNKTAHWFAVGLSRWFMNTPSFTRLRLIQAFIPRRRTIYVCLVATRWVQHVVLKLNQRQWRRFNVSTTSCVEFILYFIFMSFGLTCNLKMPLLRVLPNLKTLVLDVLRLQGKTLDSGRLLEKMCYKNV